MCYKLDIFLQSGFLPQSSPKLVTRVNISSWSPAERAVVGIVWKMLKNEETKSAAQRWWGEKWIILCKHMILVIAALRGDCSFFSWLLSKRNRPAAAVAVEIGIRQTSNGFHTWRGAGLESRRRRRWSWRSWIMLARGVCFSECFRSNNELC